MTSSSTTQAPAPENRHAPDAWAATNPTLKFHIHFRMHSRRSSLFERAKAERPENHLGNPQEVFAGPEIIGQGRPDLLFVIRSNDQQDILRAFKRPLAARSLWLAARYERSMGLPILLLFHRA
jgi:hypothetical protein